MSQCEPEQFNGREITFMSIYNDVVWRRTRKHRKIYYELLLVANYARRFLLERLVILGTWIRADGDWEKTAEGMMCPNFAESGHPIFSCHPAP